MKLVKIFSENNRILVDNIDGLNISLPINSEQLNSYVYQNEIEDKTIYFIEVSPDQNNPLNYNGVKIALNLYFRHIQENKLNFHFTLLSFDSKEHFFYDCEYSLFLKCPNVFFKQFNLNFEIKIPESVLTVDSSLAILSIKRINVKPPTSYKSHHSISNQWAISRWSHFLGLTSKFDDEIKRSLYFQYLKTIYQIKKVQSKQNFLISEGRLLLIDDEEDKGWSDFFKKLNMSSSKLKFDFLGRSFKKRHTKDDIIKESVKKIVEYKPDTVLLDLRLHDSDFEEENPEELTGFKILKEIKGTINPGIQVILFSATNKIWNYQALDIIGFDGWIIKESPDLSSDSYFTQKIIKELKSQIDYCLKRSYLRIISEEIQQLIEDLDNCNPSDFINEVKNQLNVSYSLLKEAKSKEGFAYAYISLYSVIEIVNNNFVHKNNNSEWELSDSVNLLDWNFDPNTREYANAGIEVTGNKPPEWKKFAGIYFQKWNLSDSNVIQNIFLLIRKRNGFIHNDKSILDKKDSKGRYLNHDIYSNVGFEKLFKQIKNIISCLK